jgi:hypothetical protein
MRLSSREWSDCARLRNLKRSIHDVIHNFHLKLKYVTISCERRCILDSTDLCAKQRLLRTVLVVPII